MRHYYPLQGPISPLRACLMLAIWLWITNALSKIFPAIQFKFYQITAKKYGFANFLQMVVSYFDCITNILTDFVTFMTAHPPY